MTLKQIARELNVSPSTVSRVLNGYDRNFSVKPLLREQIIAKVKESGYSVNPVFSSMRSKENRQVALLFPTLTFFTTNGIGNSSVDTIAQELLRNNYQFIHFFSPTARSSGYELPPWKVGGMIIPDVICAKELCKVEESNIPYAVINGVCGPRGAAVKSDEYHNTGLLLDHLAGFGHRRICFVNIKAQWTGHYSIVDREKAYLEYCRRHELPSCRVFYCKEQSDADNAIETALKEGATALVAYCGEIALRLFHSAWRRNIRIPQDLSIVSFNDHPSFDYSTPPLTRVKIPTEEMGRKVVKLLCERLESEDPLPPQTVTIPGMLVAGGSVAPVPC